MVSGCQRGSQDGGQQVSLRLKMQAAGEQVIFLEELGIHKTIRLDSVKFSEKEETRLRFPARESGFYLLRNKQGEVVTLLLKPGEEAEVEMDADRPAQTYRVTGSAGSEILREFAGERLKYEHVYDSLKNEFKKASEMGIFPQVKEQLDSAFQTIMRNQRTYILSLIAKHPESLSGLFLLNQFLGPVPLFKLEENPEPFLLLDSVLIKTEPGNTHVVAHHERVQKYRNEQNENLRIEAVLKPGQLLPEVQLKDPDGKTIRLKDFQGKRVLVYFWQSVNALSRRENLALRKLWMQKPVNAVLICVSLDENPEMAAAARRIDDLPGIHLNDPAGMRGSLAQKLNLNRKFPRYFWIDAGGKIIASASASTELKKMW